MLSFFVIFCCFCTLFALKYAIKYVFNKDSILLYSSMMLIAVVIIVINVILNYFIRKYAEKEKFFCTVSLDERVINFFLILLFTII